MDKQKPDAPVIKTTIINIDGKDYKVNSHFEGTETASKLLCDMCICQAKIPPNNLKQKSPRQAAEKQKSQLKSKHFSWLS